jgi:hypothetical protein
MILIVLKILSEQWCPATGLGKALTGFLHETLKAEGILFETNLQKKRKGVLTDK